MKKSMQALLMPLVMTLCVAGVARAGIINTYFDNKTQFISNNQPLSMESFEEASAIDESISTKGFTVTWGNNHFFTKPYVSENTTWATDGIDSLSANMFDGASIQYNFHSTIYAFGINLIDFASNGKSSLYFINDLGHSYTFGFPHNPILTTHFIGVTTDVPFASVTLTKTDSEAGESDFVYLDEVYYTKPVPEPTTWILLATGLLGLAGISRKKFIRKVEKMER